MATQALIWQWYQALFEADCVKVMKLLDEDPSLLKVGWTSEPERVVKGSEENYWAPKTPSPWKGRTALHVGARRGCVKLIEQVLFLCELDDIEYKSPIRQDKQESINYRYVLEKPWQRKRRLEEERSEGADSGGMEGAITAEGDHQPKVESAQTAQTPSSDGRPVLSGQSEGEGADTKCNNIVRSPQDASTSTPEVDHGSMPETAQRAAQKITSEPLPQFRKAVVNNNKQKIAPWKRLPKVQHTISHWKQMVRNGKESDQQKRGEESGRLSHSPTHSPPLSESGEGHSRDPDNIWGDLISKKELRDLLLSKDGEFELDALAMAVLTGNENLILLLVHAIGECARPPYLISKTYISREDLQKADQRNRDRLRKATEDVINSTPDDSILRTRFVDEYSRHPNFNFLCRGEYLFHFSLTSRFRKRNDEPRELRYAVQDFQNTILRTVRLVGDDELWRFFWELQDGQGRTPEHVAVDEKTCGALLGSERKIDTLRCTFTARDGAGRSSYHRAAAIEKDTEASYPLQDLGLEALGFESWEPPERIWRGGSLVALRYLSLENGFRSLPPRELAPMHVAIFSKHPAFAKVLISLWREFHKPDEVEKTWDGEFIYECVMLEFDPMELACLMGDSEFVQSLLEDMHKNEPTRKQFGHPKHMRETRWPALHIAAHLGDYKLLEQLLEDPLCNPFVEDWNGNTALHHAMKVRDFEYEPHLLEYVSCQHLLSNDLRKATRKANKTNEDDNVQRQGCVNLLLQVGCDIFKANNDGKIPYPRGTLSENEKFMSWWYGRQAREFEAVENSTNIAANAISVTAALVATASYVGPLQPPLGLGATHQIQFENGWVATFIFCDTLSFYLAVAAIMLSLIPSLPMPQQSMKDELQRTRIMVTMAVAVLFPSVVCVLIAFASSSMAVISANIISTRGGKLTVATMCIGGPVIVGAFFLFMIRLLGIWFPRTYWIKYLYKITSFQGDHNKLHRD